MKEFLFTLFIYGLMILVVAILLTLGSAPFKAYSCYNYGQLTERKTNFSIFNGCFVEHKGKFIPRSELERRFMMSDKD